MYDNYQKWNELLKI